MATAATRTRRDRSWRLSSRWRKTTLVVHIVSAGGWIGIDVVVAVLVLAGWFSDDIEVRSLVSGLVLRHDSRWGLLRYWWVAVKLGLKLVLCTLIVVALLQPWMDEASGRS